MSHKTHIDETFDAIEWRMKMELNNFMDSPKYRRLTLTASAGANISNCIREAIILCLTKDCTIVFNHNGADVEVSPHMFIDFIYEAWQKQRETLSTE